MAYVRQRGNQLAIVHGARDPETKRVEQQILFTLYSKPEALAAIGKEFGAFRHLLEERHPQHRFDWKQIRAGVMQHLGGLPETWDYQAPKLAEEFPRDMGRFARQLVLVDPRKLAASPVLWGAYQRKLTYLKELIDWRLKAPVKETSPWRHADEFGWYSVAWGSEVPPEVEERAATAYENGDYLRARAAFTVLTDAFADYAEGHNYLGLIALELLDPEGATRHFQNTIDVGSRLFPKRISRSRWWSDLSTRPYMRGLRNLALALNQSGRWQEALSVAEQLEDQCGDSINAAAYRARALLNLKQWQRALEAALSIHQMSPCESLIAAFAAFELARQDDARGLFLHAALNVPRTVAMALRAKLPPEGVPRRAVEVDDHNGGIHDLRSLAGFLGQQSRSSRNFFLQLWRSAQLTQLRGELAAIAKRGQAPTKQLDAPAFNRMTQLQSFEFARSTMGSSPGPLAPLGARARARNGTLH